MIGLLVISALLIVTVGLMWKDVGLFFGELFAIVSEFSQSARFIIFIFIFMCIILSCWVLR